MLLFAAAIVAVALVAPAGAQTLYKDGTIEIVGIGSGSSRTCEVAFVPSERRGASPPRLVLHTQDRFSMERIGIGLANAGDYSEAVLVLNNQRESISASETLAFDEFQRSSLGSALSAGGTFFLTARHLASREIVSARYEDIDFRSVLLRVEEHCPFYAEGLLGDSYDREQAERTLNLSQYEATYIRWVLADRYDSSGIEPEAGTQLTETERSYLLQYAAENGLPMSRYLNYETSRRLLAETFLPTEYEDPYIDNIRWHNDWFNGEITYNDGDLGCRIGSRMTYSNEESFWQYPYMLYEAYRSGSGSSLILDMVSPNPFDVGYEVYAYVDGSYYDLNFDNDAVKPPPAGGDSVDSSVITAIRRGQQIEIVGVSRMTGNELRIGFSGSGFTAAFNDMIRSCNRSGLRSWIQ